MTLRSSRANDLADAAQAIANANHYLVGFVDVPTFTVEEFQEANQVLIDRELQAMRASDTDAAEEFELAFIVLDLECFARHRVHLSH